MSESPGTPEGQPGSPPPPPPPPPYGQVPGQPPARPIGVPPAGPYGQVPHGYGHPYAPPGYPLPVYGRPMRDPDARPGTVLAAGIVTLVMTGLMLLLLGGITFFLVASRSSLLEGIGAEAGLDAGSTADWFTPILVVLLVAMGWCVLAMVLAILAMHRHNWARIGLLVSSGLTVVVSLVAITGGVSVVPLACAIAVIVCLFTGGAGDWFHHEHPYSPPTLPKL